MWFDDKGMRVLSLWDPHHPTREVDLFVENPIDFDLLYERSQIVALAATNVRIASIEDLIQLKRLANRPEDQRDIEALQAIRRTRRDG
jgi:predicted nucleotidyltransferase